MTPDRDESPDDRETQRLTRHFDSQKQPPATAVLDTIEAHSDVAATDLPPLRERVDPNALNAFIEQAPATPDGDPLRVEFAYAGYLVSVHSDDRVTVTPRQ